jgi:hypothetical protein
MNHDIHTIHELKIYIYVDIYKVHSRFIACVCDVEHLYLDFCSAVLYT